MNVYDPAIHHRGSIRLKGHGPGGILDRLARKGDTCVAPNTPNTPGTAISRNRQNPHHTTVAAKGNNETMPHRAAPSGRSGLGDAR